MQLSLGGLITATLALQRHLAKRNPRWRRAATTPSIGAFARCRPLLVRIRVELPPSLATTIWRQHQWGPSWAANQGASAASRQLWPPGGSHRGPRRHFGWPLRLATRACRSPDTRQATEIIPPPAAAARVSEVDWSHLDVG